MKRSKSFSIQKKRVLSRGQTRNSQDKSKEGTAQHRRQQSVPEAIRQHIDKHSDVEIIVYYDQYKEQFFLKCKKLQEYLYANPIIREKYLSEDNSHFKNSFQFLLLDLYRRGVIVPGSYDNLRAEAVKELENWTLSWIQRKLLYEKAMEEEKAQIIRTYQALTEMEDYIKIVEVEELPF